MKSSQVWAVMAVVSVLAPLEATDVDWISRSFRLIAFVCVLLMIATAASERRSS